MDWIILDTETTGLKAPIYTVEIAAQRMSGWEAKGSPFRRLVNQNVQIPQEVSRVHGYTREILERDGFSPSQVYEELKKYTENAPICSYNLQYDWECVMEPELKRLGLDAKSFTPGFCLLRFAQRLLEAIHCGGNYKLQTLRQYFHLPERGSHTALGDVRTVVDLLQIFRPLAEAHGWTSYERWKKVADEEYFPEFLVFGKYRGRSVWEARKDSAFKQYLEFLARSENPSIATMGRYYTRLIEEERKTPIVLFSESVEKAEGNSTELVLRNEADIKIWKEYIELSRARLVEIETRIISEKAKIQSVKAILFKRLRTLYEERDRWKTKLRYRQLYLKTLLQEGEEAAKQVCEEEQAEQEKIKGDYDSAGNEIEMRKKELDQAEMEELKTIHRKLARLFHPDLFQDDPEKSAVYEKLMAMINLARDTRNISLLREIANDPMSYLAKQGWQVFDFYAQDEQIEKLQRLWQSLQREIVERLEVLDSILQSEDFELWTKSRKNTAFLELAIEDLSEELLEETAVVKSECESLEKEILQIEGVG